MTTQNLILAYFGTTTRAEALAQLAEAEASFMLPTGDMLNTLGQVIMMYPNVIIVDDAEAGAIDFVMHLRSVNIGNILILSDTPRAWNISSETNTIILPSDSSEEAILAAARVLAAGELEPA